MVSAHMYIKNISYRQCIQLKDILKENNCTIKFDSSKNIVFSNITSLLELENGFYNVVISGNNENDVLEKIKYILK